MEDVLNLYHEPYDETRPVICFDESARLYEDTNATRSRPDRERSLIRSPLQTKRETANTPLDRTADWLGERRNY